MNNRHKVAPSALYLGAFIAGIYYLYSNLRYDTLNKHKMKY